MISKTITGILRRFTGKQLEFNNILFEYIEKDVIQLTASTGFILFTATVTHLDIAPFDTFMVHKKHLRKIDEDCTLCVVGDEVYFMVINGSVVTCGKESGEYPNHIRAMRQKCKEKPMPQELDARFMRIIFDSAAELSNDLHISPGNDKEAFIVISGNCKFAIMPRG